MAEGFVPNTDMNIRKSIRTIRELIEHHSEYRGEHIAFYFDDKSYTFSDWNKRSRQMANGLFSLGLKEGDRVSHIGKNNSCYYDILGGCSKSRMVLSPINWRLATPETVDLINDFDIKLVFLGAEFFHLIDIIRLNCPKVRTIIGIDAATDDQPEFEDWLALQSENEPNIQSEWDDVLLQIHTSGTTGKPKGAMLSNGNVLSVACHSETGDIGQWNDRDINLTPLPLFHSGGVCYAFCGIYAGAASYIVREAHPDLILDAFQKQPITKSNFVPAIIQILLNHPDFDARKMKSLEYVFYGGSPITAALLEEAIGKLDCKFSQRFGMTESSTSGTTLSPQDHDLTRPELLKSCGRPTSDMEIRIVDANRNELARGQVGEIAMKSPCIMQGYYNRPEETAQVLVDGWYYSGDVGMVTEDGYFYILDRLKDMIISGGENIYPAEVEQVLARHPAILECGVIGVPSQKWNEEVKACVVLRSGQQVSEDELIKFCRASIAGYKCPKSIDFVDALPRNANGKIVKMTLREPYWKGIDRQVN